MTAKRYGFGVLAISHRLINLLCRKASCAASLIGLTGFCILVFIGINSVAWGWDCDPPCGDCYYCDASNNCVWGCSSGETCCDGSCCDPQQCAKCVSGQCRESKCNPANCESCDGHGNCVVCDGNSNETCCHGSCIPTGTNCCDDGTSCPSGTTCCDGSCCPPGYACCSYGGFPRFCCPQGWTLCGQWVGGTNPMEFCCDPSQCKSCVNGNCAVCGNDPTMCCASGNCISKCDDGSCCDPGQCLTCINGQCQSIESCECSSGECCSPCCGSGWGGACPDGSGASGASGAGAGGSGGGAGAGGGGAGAGGSGGGAGAGGGAGSGGAGGGGGSDGFGGSGPGTSTAGEPVYINNGEFRTSVTDLSIPGRGLPINIKRPYGSRRIIDKFIFGYGWDMSYDIKIERLGSPVAAIVFFNGTGRSHKFALVGDVNSPRYVNSSNPADYFLLVNGTFKLYKDNGQVYEFDANDRISSIRDRHNNSINFGYTGGVLTKITDTLNHAVTLSYQGSLITAITDSSGRTWTYTYDPDTNDLLGVTYPPTEAEPNGLTTTYTYESHYLTSITDPNGDLLFNNCYDSYYSDGTGRVYRQYVGSTANYFQFDYNSARCTTVTNRQGHKKDMAYNNNYQLAAETIYTDNPAAEPNGFTTQYIYDPVTGRRTRIIYPRGNCVDYTYDSNGHITGAYYKAEPNDPNSASDPNVIATLYTYDSNFTSEVNSVTDAMGNITYFDHNAVTGDLVQIRYPQVNTAGGLVVPVKEFTYNSYGQVETATAPDGIVTEYVYYSDINDVNNYGRLWKIIADYNVIDGCNITTAYKYDALGRIIEVNDPNGDVVQSEYDNLDQLTEFITPSPYNYVTKFGYDNKSNLSKIERVISGGSGPNQVVNLQYDKQDNLSSLVNPLGFMTQYGYNKNDDPNIVTDAQNNATLTEYNERRLVTKITDANGGITCFDYDENGNLEDVNDPNGNITGFVYDRFNRLVKIIYPDGSNEVFCYDKNGNITSRTTRQGDTISYQYDAMNRLTTKSRPDANIVFVYDIAGRVVEVNDGSVAGGGGITMCKYDRLGRVSEVNDIEGRTVKYEYDSRGLRTKMVYPDDSNVTYEYDALYRLTKVRYNGVSVAEYGYDGLSRRTLLQYGNDTNIVYVYDLGNQLKRLTNNLAGGTTIDFNYANYDKVGNRLSMKVNDANAQTYTYDNLYQLLYVDYNDGNTANYYYDVLGNRTAVTNGSATLYQSNCLNQYVKVADTNYFYDLNGNIYSDGNQIYSYDCENRLTRLMGTNAYCRYQYDFAGRRVWRRIQEPLPVTTTIYDYDGDRIIADYNSAGVLQRKYVYGPGIDEPIMMIIINGGETQYYYHLDGLGSVVALSDANSHVVEKYTYDIFGKPAILDANGVLLTASAYGNRFMFTGREFDTETGNYYYRARYYKPSIGRFLQPDPIRYTAGLNLYTYLNNNPINRIDPYGLFNWGQVDWGQVASGAGTAVLGGLGVYYGIGIAGNGIVAAGTGVGTAPGVVAAVGGTALAMLGEYGVARGVLQMEAGFAGGNLQGMPGTYTGMMLSPAGNTASQVGDIAETIATGGKGALNVTATVVQVIDMLINPPAPPQKSSDSNQNSYKQ